MPKTRSPMNLKRRDAMIAALRNAHNLMERQEHQAAKSLLAEVARDAAFSGVESPHLAWGLAIVSDYLGDLSEAFIYISKAIRLDPLSPSIEHSFRIICKRMRSALADPNRDAADPTTPKLYRNLVQVGKADDASHLAMARYFDASGKPEESLKVLEALTVIAPACREAWELKATLLAKLGRDGVEEAAAEAGLCATGSSSLFAESAVAEA